jgi:trigger factor
VTQQTLQEFKNDHVNFTVQHKPACIVEYHVHISPALAKSAHKQGVKNVLKEVSLPGFRKGRAPESLVEKSFPADVDKKWQEVLAQDAFIACQELAKLPFLRESRITFTTKKHSLHDGAEMILSFEIEPEAPVIDPSQITLKAVKRPEVNEEKVKETIRQVQFFFATWEPITDRAVKKEDCVTLDVDVVQDTPHTSLFSNTRFEVTHKGMAKWMYDAVIGMHIGESREAVSTPDADASAEEKETFKPKKVKITLKSIELATLPEVDDAFAEKLGVKNVHDLNKAIEKILTEQADAHVKQEMRTQIDNYLLDNYDFEIPGSLVEKEARLRIQMLQQDPQFIAQWEASSPEERKETLSSLFHQAKKAVKMFYLCRRVIADADIQISPKDIPSPPDTMLEALLVHRPTFDDAHDPQMRQAEIVSRLLLEKAEDYLIERANKA